MQEIKESQYFREVVAGVNANISDTTNSVHWLNQKVNVENMLLNVTKVLHMFTAPYAVAAVVAVHPYLNRTFDKSSVSQDRLVFWSMIAFNIGSIFALIDSLDNFNNCQNFESCIEVSGETIK